MRLFVLFVLSVLLKRCTGESGKKITGTMKIEIGLYCPDKTNWEYRIEIRDVDNPPPAISGKATGHFAFPTLENVITTSEFVDYCLEDTCTSDGKWRPCIGVYVFKLKENKVTYAFLGVNLKEDYADDYVLEKLFIHYLQKECPTGDCSAIRDRVFTSCRTYVTEVENTCKDTFEKALKLWMEERDSTSNTTIFIIVGSAVGVVLLIALVVTFFICKRKKKKANKQTGSGMTGTGTGSNTMTKSGATKQGTTTGTLQKTRTVGTGNTGNTTTGGQRY